MCLLAYIPFLQPVAYLGDGVTLSYASLAKNEF